MQRVDIAGLAVVGALGFERTADGLVYRRFPDWAAPQIVDPFQRAVATMPAGVRLEFATASPAIELDVRLTSFGYAAAGVPLTTPVFDLVVDGAVAASRVVEPTELQSSALNERISAFTSATATVRFDELPGDPGVPVEVWFPHSSIVELLEVRIDDGAEVAALQRDRRRWIHHGSSISHCLSAPTPTAMWPAIVALRNDVDLLDLGFSGNCMLDQHVARSIRDSAADFISVKAGINVINGDTMRERTFIPAVHGFLDTIREGHLQTPLILATPIICPPAEDHPGPTLTRDDGTVRVVARDPELSDGALTLRRVRELIGEIVAARRDPHLHLLDGLALFGPDDLANLPDSLHPDAAGYRTMADRFHALAFAADRPFA